MPTDILRLFLILAGIGLVVGIYLWDRYKRINGRVMQIQRAQTSSGSGRSEPKWKRSNDDVDLDNIDDDLGILSKSVHGDDDLTVEDDINMSFAAEDFDEPEIDYKNLPEKIIQINIIAKRSEGFKGQELMYASKRAGLALGRMDIFHFTKDGEELFSMASMVEPGNFPVDNMQDFETPGLVMFAQLPTQLDGMKVFDQMLSSAAIIAKQIYGELQDHTHSDLSRQTIEHIRQEIMEFERQLRLAKARQR